MSEKARKIFELVKAEGRNILTELEAKEVIRAYNIPTTQEKLAKNADEAVLFASEIGFPVALKICSPDIIHKTDAGGVQLNIKSPEEVRKTYTKTIENAREYKTDAKIAGVAIENMVEAESEVIVGLIKDPQFGPVIMFGLGGVFVEIFKDISFRLAPVNGEEALEMIQEIRGFPILMGYRGRKPANIDAIAEIITKTSKIAMDLHEIKEMDLNPIFVHEKGATAVDARIVLT